MSYWLEVVTVGLTVSGVMLVLETVYQFGIAPRLPKPAAQAWDRVAFAVNFTLANAVLVVCGWMEAKWLPWVALGAVAATWAARQMSKAVPPPPENGPRH